MTTQLGRTILELNMLDSWAFWNEGPTRIDAGRAMEKTEQLTLAVGSKRKIISMSTDRNGPTNLRTLAAVYLGPQISSGKIQKMVAHNMYEPLIGTEWSPTAFYYKDFWGYLPNQFCPNKLQTIDLWRNRVNEGVWPGMVTPELRSSFNQKTLRSLGNRFLAYESTLETTLRRVRLHEGYVMNLISHPIGPPILHPYEYLIRGGEQARKACGGFAKLFLGAVAPALALSVTFSQIYESNPDQRAEVLFASVRDMFKPLPIAVFEAMVA